MASLPLRFDSSRHFARRVGLLFTVCALLGLAPAAAQTEFSAKTLLEPIVDEYGPKYQDVESAIEQLRSGRLTEARDTLATARQKNPELPPANMLLADILFRFNQLNMGVAALEEAAKEEASDPGAYVYLGELALRSRRFTEANLLFEKGLELCNQYTANDKRKNRLLLSIYGGLATLAERNDNMPESNRYLDELLKIEPTNTLGLLRKGRVVFKMAKDKSDENEAYKIFQQLYRSSPENTAFPDVNMGLLYEQAGKPDNANALMQNAIKKDGDNIRTRLSVAKWALDTNRLDVAKENANAALKLDPSSLDAKLYVGLVARFTNDLGTAEQMFREANQQSPTNLAALTQLCLALVDQPDEAKKQKALEYAKMNVQMHTDLNQVAGREAAVTYAWVLSRLGRTAEALNAIQQILPAVTTLSADSAYHAAKILYDSGQNEAARKILELKLTDDAVFPNRGDAEQLLSRIRSNP